MTTTAGPVIRRHLDPIRTGADCRDLPAGGLTADTLGAEPGGRLRVLPPDAVPAGATVLGLLVVLPADGEPPRPDRAEASRPTPRRLVALSTAHEPDAAPERVPLECGPGLVLDPWGRRVLRAGDELNLTRREYQLFERLVTHPGRAFTRP